MENLWHPQRNTADAPIALIKNFIHSINLPISRETIEKEVKNHPEYPLLSFGAIIHIIKQWGIESISYQWTIDKLNEIPSPSILFIHSEADHVKSGEFVIFHELRENTVVYLHTRKGWVLEQITEFEQKWSKAALSLIAINNTDGESDFEEKEKQYEAKKWSNPELKNVQIKNNFLTAEECDYIIELSKNLFNRSKLMKETNIEDDGRTSYSAELAFPNDTILNGIRQRASELLKIPESHFEFFQCVSYDKSQEYRNHYDTFDDTSERGRKVIAEGGQRKYTMLAYLNDDFEGGGTHFPNLDLLVHPEKRRVVIFNNLDKHEKVIPASYHAGLPVTYGRKYVINMWVRTKPLV